MVTTVAKGSLLLSIFTTGVGVGVGVAPLSVTAASAALCVGVGLGEQAHAMNSAYIVPKSCQAYLKMCVGASWRPRRMLLGQLLGHNKREASLSTSC